MSAQTPRQTGPVRSRLRPPSLGSTLWAVPVVAAVGALGLPAVLSGSTGERRAPQNLEVAAAVAAEVTPSSAADRAAAAKRAALAGTPSTSAGPVPERTALAAFDRAGYDHDDAVLLARLWDHGISPFQAKVRAGTKLAQLTDAELPILPGQTPWTVSPDAALEAFFDNGYDYDDATRLARLWKYTPIQGDLSRVKVAAGRNVLAGRAIESAPRGPLSASDAQLRAAFARAGYHRADAVLLARLWGENLSPADATRRAGQKLLAGDLLPTRPGQTARTVSQDVALDAFFGHGYDYDDATRLAKIWHRAADDLTPVKAAAGRKILAGGSLPIGH